MTSRSFKLTALALVAAAPVLLPAQESTAKEEERMAALSRNEGQQWYSPRTKVSVGFRFLSSGGRVDFSNLGTVPFLYEPIPASAGEVSRFYSNGKIRADGPRSIEVDADGNQVSVPGVRYIYVAKVTVPVLDADGNDTGTTQEIDQLVGNYLAYAPGLTRDWEVATSDQLSAKPGYVAVSNFAAISEGGTASKKQGASGGVELQVNKEIGRGTRHFKWGVLAGVTLNDINSKTSGAVASTLRTYTDYYSTNGLTVPSNQIGNPAIENVFDHDGDGVQDDLEYTVPLSSTPDSSLTTDVTTPGGATVTGRWQVKGAYFMLKLGPTLHTQITERLGLTASAGLAGAYAGTRYTAYESFTVASLPDVTLETTDSETGDTTLSSTATKFMTGYYADLNLEWTANESFGLFGGVTAQQLGDYEQKLGDRLAKIDLGSTVGIRGGVSIRF